MDWPWPQQAAIAAPVAGFALMGTPAVAASPRHAAFQRCLRAIAFLGWMSTSSSRARQACPGAHRAIP